MTPVALQKYGLVRIGRIELSDDLIFSVIFELDEAKTWQRSIYAFVVGGEIKRIGSSNYYLRDRFRKWNHDVTNALHGKKSDTPSWRQRTGENASRHTRVERCMHASPGTPLSRF